VTKKNVELKTARLSGLLSLAVMDGHVSCWGLMVIELSWETFIIPWFCYKSPSQLFLLSSWLN